jgi:hypothetical protein
LTIRKPGRQEKEGRLSQRVRRSQRKAVLFYPIEREPDWIKGASLRTKPLGDVHDIMTSFGGNDRTEVVRLFKEKLLRFWEIRTC